MRKLATLTLLASLGIVSLSAAVANSPDRRPESKSGGQQVKAEHNEAFPMHTHIPATIFWVGEEEDETNAFIHNRSSAWVEDWVTAFGGVDDPKQRCNHLPCGFIPKENPYYYALPYNDLDDQGKRKPSAVNVPWYRDVISTNPTSVVKNRWAKITHEGQSVYAQWEDAGPFYYDDFDYVFGTGQRSWKEAGIDLSPTTASHLGIDGLGDVSWQFVEEAEVPDGPWRRTITRQN